MRIFVVEHQSCCRADHAPVDLLYELFCCQEMRDPRWIWLTTPMQDVLRRKREGEFGVVRSESICPKEEDRIISGYEERRPTCSQNTPSHTVYRIQYFGGWPGRSDQVNDFGRRFDCKPGNDLIVFSKTSAHKFRIRIALLSGCHDQIAHSLPRFGEGTGYQCLGSLASIRYPHHHCADVDCEAPAFGISDRERPTEFLNYRATR